MSSNEDFDQIVNQLDMEDMTDPRTPDELSIWEVHQAAVGLSQSLMLLNTFLLDHANKKDVSLPEEVSEPLRMLTEICETVVDLLMDCDCPECRDCEDCGDGEYCVECYEAIVEQANDDED